MDALRARFAVFGAAEQRLAVTRRAAAEARARRASVGAGAGLGVSAVLLLALAGYLSRREAGEAAAPTAAGLATDTLAELEAAFEPTRAALIEALGSQ